MAVKKANGGTSDAGVCPVVSERGGVVYRCHKPAGHEQRDPGDWEHIAEAVGSVEAGGGGDFRRMVEDALPLLYHLADTDPARREAARRIIVRYHMTMTSAGRRGTLPT